MTLGNTIFLRDQSRIQKPKMVRKGMWRSANLIKFQRNFMRLALLHIRLPTPRSDPEIACLKNFLTKLSLRSKSGFLIKKNVYV